MRMLDRERNARDAARLAQAATRAQWKVLAEIPTACPKCDKALPLVITGREIHCSGLFGGCGETYYLLADSST